MTSPSKTVLTLDDKSHTTLCFFSLDQQLKEMHETVISKNQLATSCHPYLYTPRCILYKTCDAVYVEFSIMLVSTLFTAINAVKINKHSEVALLELLLLRSVGQSFLKGRGVALPYSYRSTCLPS